MRRYIKIISVLLVLVMSIGILAGCNNKKGDNVIDFDNYTNDMLSKIAGEEVILYGYFALNSSIDNMTYMTSLPFTALINNQEDASNPQFYDVKLSDGAMPVYFKSEPEYTTAPVKVTGKLTRVKTYDNVNYISYEYAITDATYSPIEGYTLGVGFKEFVSFAKMGYPDVVYQNILQLELFSYDLLDNFPEEEEYENIMKDMSNAPNQPMYQEYIELVESVHMTFEYYKTQLSTTGSIAKEDVMMDANTLVKALIEYMDKYASFKVVYDKDAGYYKLESVNAYISDGTTSTTTPSTSTTQETTEESKENNQN